MKRMKTYMKYEECEKYEKCENVWKVYKRLKIKKRPNRRVDIANEDDKKTQASRRSGISFLTPIGRYKPAQTAPSVQNIKRIDDGAPVARKNMML